MPDTLSGGKYADHIVAYNGDDRLFGNGGTDVLNAGGGNDTMDGGYNTSPAAWATTPLSSTAAPTRMQGIRSPT